MPKFNDLYDDPRFSGISKQTKTDIINTIGLDMTSAEEEIVERKFTQEQLSQALHYMLAREAKENNLAVQRLVVRESSADMKIPFESPFYFSNNDPFLWYWIDVNSSSHSNDVSLCIGSDCVDNDGKGALIVCALTCACAAGCCCAFCMSQTIQGQESEGVKVSKVTISSVTGLASFIFLLWYLINQQIWRSNFVTHSPDSPSDYQADVTFYYLFLTFVASAAGFLASGVVSGINNTFLCLPAADQDWPEPSPEILAALAELSTVESLLKKGWTRPGDESEQCNALIREVIQIYIKAIASPLVVKVKDSPVSPGRSRSAIFSRVSEPPKYGAVEGYVALPEEASNQAEPDLEKQKIALR